MVGFAEATKPDVEATFVFVRPTPDTKPLLNPSLDPDGDGFSNLLEYAMGLEPKIADTNVPGFGVADGSFSLYVHLNGTQSDEGTATATVTDWWGLTSATVSDYVHQSGV